MESSDLPTISQQEKKEIDILRHLSLPTYSAERKEKGNCLGGKNGGEGLHSISHTGETENKHGKGKERGRSNMQFLQGASLPHAATYQQSRRKGGEKKEFAIEITR